jgi:Family of unknown function (DUF6326)
MSGPSSASVSWKRRRGILDARRDSSPASATTTKVEVCEVKTDEARDMKSFLSLLWIFYMFNASYIDITTLYYSVFINHKPAVHYTQVFLLGAGVLIEISIAMVLLARILRYTANRRANIITGIFLTVVQIASLFVKTPTLVYAFFSIILIATSAVIAWCAWRWSNPEVSG